MAGDAESEFSEFVSARYSVLLRSAYLLVGDPGLAEDLVQAALFRTFRSWERLRATQAAESYTGTTMLRMSRRWSRRLWHREVLGVLGTESDGRASGVETDVAMALDVRRALTRLPWTQRAVLVLRYFDDLSEAETAQVLGCSVGTVKSRASRGLAGTRTARLLERHPAEDGVRDG